jgi:glutaminase
MVIATVDGHVYEVGATRQRSRSSRISKPWIYGVALEDRGASACDRRSAWSRAATRSPISLNRAPDGRQPERSTPRDCDVARLRRHRRHTRPRVTDAVSAYAGRALDIDEACSNRSARPVTQPGDRSHVAELWDRQ